MLYESLTYTHTVITLELSQHYCYSPLKTLLKFLVIAVVGSELTWFQSV